MLSSLSAFIHYAVQPFGHCALQGFLIVCLSLGRKALKISVAEFSLWDRCREVQIEETFVDIRTTSVRLKFSAMRY